MKFKYKYKITITCIFINFVVLTTFFYFIFNANTFKKYSIPVWVQAYSNNLNILKEEITDWSIINVNNIYIDDDLPWVIYYIVQNWDCLSKIASNFWVTVSHIKKVNNLKSDIITPWQKLTITDQDGFIYTSKWETVELLSRKFHINIEDILDANGLSDKYYKFDKWDEVFIPMSEEQYKKLFSKYNKKTKKTYITNPSIATYYKKWNIVTKYRYRPNITNWFYRWHCTRYVAIKKFPYITVNKQKKLWNWNARYWYKNAKVAGYSVWQIPKVWSIVVISVWWARYYYAWHVGIVKRVDRAKKMLLIEEMNYLWKYIVTQRWIPMNKKIIIWYIYL